MATESNPLEVRLRDALHAAARDAPLSPEFATSVIAGLPERPTGRSGIRLALASAAVVAGVLVIAAVAMTLWQGQAPGPGAADEWGPLAVTASTGGDLALTHGTLRIGDSCVLLEQAQNELTMLVWPADRTSWDPTTRSITFANLDGRRVTLTDGETVSFGGGGDSTEEGGVSGEAWRDGMDWVSPPGESCPLDSRWSVGEVVTAGSD